MRYAGNALVNGSLNYLRGRNLSNMVRNAFTPDGAAIINRMANVDAGSPQAIALMRSLIAPLQAGTAQQSIPTMSIRPSSNLLTAPAN